MDQFENNVVPTTAEEQDPVAEFLAREQSALAGLDIDNNQIRNDDDDNNDDNNILNNNNHDDADDGFNNLEQNDNFEIINSLNNGNNDIAIDQENDDDVFGSNFKLPSKQPKIESDKIRKWHEDQKLILQKKDEEEEIKKRELHEQAKNELEDWYKKHDESIAKTKLTNRNADKQMENVANIDKIEPGMEWERIAKLCDFNSKTNKSNKDVSRMRSILLQLKQQN